MTAEIGSEKQIRVDLIDIPEDRFRWNLKEIESLQLSLDRRQIYPIIVQPETTGRFTLIDGRRRLVAAKNLGWTTIRAIAITDLDDLSRRELELEADIQRQQLTWQERACAFDKLHELKVQHYGAAAPGRFSGGWSIQDTARLACVSAATMNQDLILAQAMKKMPEIGEAGSRRDAIKMLRGISKGQLPSVAIEAIRNKLKETFHLGNWMSSPESIADGVIPFVLTDLSEQPLEPVITQLHRVMAEESEGYLFFSLEQLGSLKVLLSRFGFSSSTTPHFVSLKGEDRVFNFTWIGKKLTSPPSVIRTMYNAKRDNFIHQMDKPYSVIFTLIGQAGERGHTIFDPFAYGGMTPLIARYHKKNCIAYCNVEAIYEQAIERLVKDHVGEKFLRGDNNQGEGEET